MFVFQILAFGVLLFSLAWKFKIQLVEAFPVGCAIWVLMLYVLSFLGALPFSDIISVAVLVIAALYTARMEKGERALMAEYSRQEFSSAATWTAFALAVAVTVCVSGKVVSWWDDYNFWATDVKTLYYLDGFAGKYENVAAEFGDYPPGTQMMKWWFLHFSPKEFKEGLMFAGYYFMNLAFLFPMLKALKGRNVFAMAAGAAVLWLFPAVAEVFWCDGCCADLTMALVYGNFLVSVVDRDRHGKFFYYARQALLLMVLVLIKNTGFIWVAFGLLFDYGFHWMQHKSGDIGQVEKRNCEEKRNSKEKRNREEERNSKEKRNREGNRNYQEGREERKCLFLVTLAPVLVEMSWLGFCIWNRRIAKLTGTAIQMATGGMNIPAYQGEMVKAFVEAFVKWPLHKWKTVAVDITPLGMYLLLLLFVFLLYKFHVLDRKLAGYTGFFLAVTGILFYTVNLISHLTIFAVETQYLEPFGMASSIERYGAPFVIGGLYLLAYYAMEKCSSKAGIIFCVLFVLLTTDYRSAYRALYGYRSRTEGVLAEREGILGDAAESFLEAVGAGERETIGRVLYLRDNSDLSWVRNTYIGFEAAPVSVMCGNLDAAAIGEEDIIKAVRDAHAGFLYVDSSAKAGEEVFRALTGGEEFQYGCLYKVTEGAEGMRLVPFMLPVKESSGI